MASGNFLIGNNFSLQGFNEYVQPIFEKRAFTIANNGNKH